MRPTRIAAKRLSAGYSRTPALTDVTFEAVEGERIALLGPNGGGKTTLIRALAGEIPELEGNLAIEGSIGVVPQHDPARADWPASALDFVTTGTLDRLPWWRVPGRKERAAALEALDSVGLADRANVTYGDLSGGQRRRAQIAAALVSGADTLLLDEPFAGLDSVATSALEDLFDSLAGSGATLLIATHDLDQARSFEKVLCLNGRQVAFGDPATVLDRPTLEATFGADLVELPGGRLIAPPHHHDHH